MKKITTEDIKNLRSHFKAIGWGEEDIAPALNKIKSNPGKHTVVMPKHYEEEAKLHAKSTCEVLGLKKKSESYERTYKQAYNEYLNDAYSNSTGIDIEGLQRQNPTTPRSVAAFQAAITGPKSPYLTIIKKLENSPLSNDVQSAEKFKRSLKSGAMTIAHLYLRYVGGMVTKQASFPDLSFVSAATSYQFLEKTSKMNADERDIMLRSIGQNNLMRGLVLAATLKVLEPIFRMDYKEINQIVLQKLQVLPASVYTDNGWLTRFNTTLEYIIAKRILDLDMKEIINDTFVHVLATYRPTVGEGNVVEAMGGAQTVTLAELNKAKGEFMNALNNPGPEGNKIISKQANNVLKSTLVPGLSYDFSDLMESPKKKNPTAKVGPVKKKKKA